VNNYLSGAVAFREELSKDLLLVDNLNFQLTMILVFTGTMDELEEGEIRSSDDEFFDGGEPDTDSMKLVIDESGVSEIGGDQRIRNAPDVTACDRQPRITDYFRPWGEFLGLL
jgi:hypothetical protein